MPPTAIDPATIAAYQGTDYWVEAEPPFVMRVGQPCAELAPLYAAGGHHACAFISACNPLGDIASDELNDARQAAFARLLGARGLPFLSGAGRDPHGAYPAEASLLVLGTGLEASKAIGRELHQNAIIWCGADRVPQLILLR